MLTLTSRHLADSLSELRNQYKGRVVKARLNVPPEMSWWYFQEFGSASGNTGAAGFDEDFGSMQDIPSAGSNSYKIAAVNAPFLVLPEKDGHLSRFVELFHPGVKTPHAFVRTALKDIHDLVSTQVADALVSNEYSVYSVREAVFAVMPSVADLIGNSMDSAIHNSREYGGKLPPGESPGDAFRSSAYFTTVD